MQKTYWQPGTAVVANAMLGQHHAACALMIPQTVANRLQHWEALGGSHQPNGHLVDRYRFTLPFDFDTVDAAVFIGGDRYLNRSLLIRFQRGLPAKGSACRFCQKLQRIADLQFGQNAQVEVNGFIFVNDRRHIVDAYPLHRRCRFNRANEKDEDFQFYKDHYRLQNDQLYLES